MAEADLKPTEERRPTWLAEIKSLRSSHRGGPRRPRAAAAATDAAGPNAVEPRKRRPADEDAEMEEGAAAEEAGRRPSKRVKIELGEMAAGAGAQWGLDEAKLVAWAKEKCLPA